MGIRAGPGHHERGDHHRPRADGNDQDWAVAVCALAQALGMPCRIIITRARPSPEVLVRAAFLRDIQEGFGEPPQTTIDSDGLWLRLDRQPAPSRHVTRRILYVNGDVENHD